MKEKLGREPVMIAAGVTAVMAALGMLVALDVIDLSNTQLASIETFLQALAAVLAVMVPLVAAWLARDKVTPMSDPRTNDGQPGQIIER